LGSDAEDAEHMEDDEELTKIVVDLPNHWATGGEGMWAKPLGGELFEIRNVPFYAYGLNFADVVRAVEPASNQKPVIQALVEAGGHRTLRVFFADSVPLTECPSLLKQLNRFRAYFEGATPRYFAIDVEPDGDYEATRAQLDRWRAEGVLEFETCEPRVPGSFDDAPDE
jgi:hypothetical protein